MDCFPYAHVVVFQVVYYRWLFSTEMGLLVTEAVVILLIFSFFCAVQSNNLVCLPYLFFQQNSSNDAGF